MKNKMKKITSSIILIYSLLLIWQFTVRTDDNGELFSTETVVGALDTNSDSSTLSNSLQNDTDGDGISNLVDVDDDNDGYTDFIEGLVGTNPLDSNSTPIDSENDGIPDSIDDDDDNDGYTDVQETSLGTNPNDEKSYPINIEKQDSDTDGLSDNVDDDDDNDGYTDLQELYLGTNPLDKTSFPVDIAKYDSDGDGIPDSEDTDDDNDGMTDIWELFYGLNYLSNDAQVDVDGDQYVNVQEFSAGTNPRDKTDYPGKSPSPLEPIIGGITAVALGASAYAYFKKKLMTKSDLVHFTITSPSEVEQQSSFIVDLWAHLDKQREEVLKRVCELADKNKINIQSFGPERLTRGTILLVELQIDELSIKNPIKKIRWEREIARVNFCVKVPKGVSKGEKAASVKIYTEGCLISILNFTIKISNTTKEVEPLTIAIKQYHKAFCSYAHADRDLVIPRIQMVKKVVPGMEIFLDVLSLRSGERWEEKLWEVIPKHDIFYLFWSQNAKDSEWVEKEWRCALKAKGLDFIDPVPLSSDFVPPPPELAEKHFYNGILKHMSK